MHNTKQHSAAFPLSGDATSRAGAPFGIEVEKRSHRSL